MASRGNTFFQKGNVIIIIIIIVLVGIKAMGFNMVW